jgi:MFS transporter, DHA3 family, tetracycline resistance protein
MILLAQVLWGIGYTFTSGATQAWLSDEIGEENANRAFLRGNRFDLAGALVGMLIAIPLGNIAVNLPILVGGAAVIGISVALLLFMPETGFRPAPPKTAIPSSTWATFSRRASLRPFTPGAAVHSRYRFHLRFVFRRLGPPVGQIPGR